MATTVDVAQANGIVIPQIAWDCSQATGVPFWATCAFLMQETAGGHNVYGHDGGATGWFSGAGTVTEANYRTYKAGRASHMAQGVGPMQLTWPPFQDAADALGGCWQPIHNVTQGLRILKGFIDAGKTWHQTAAAYNGSEAYADQMDSRFAQWQQLLEHATPPGGEMDRTLTKVNVSDHPFSNGRYSDGVAKLCDQDTLDRYQAACEDLGYASTDGSGLSITQGAFHTGYPPSAGTHDGSGVCDLNGTFEPGKKQLALAKVGCIYFYRTAADGFSVHGHTVSKGNPHLQWLARSQVTAFYGGMNGLANRGPFRLAPGVDNIPHLVDWHGQQSPPPKDPPPDTMWPVWAPWPGLDKTGWGPGNFSDFNLWMACAVGIRGYAGWYGDVVDKTWDGQAMKGLQRWQDNHQPWAGRDFTEQAWNAIGHIPTILHDGFNPDHLVVNKESHESFFAQMLLILQGFQAQLDQHATRIWRPHCIDAVRAFQAHVGIKVDGVLGPVTWSRLWEHHS